MPGQTDQDRIASHVWSLDCADGRSAVPYLYFLPNGRVGGSMRDSIRRWQIDAGAVTFFDRRGQPSARLIPDADGRLQGHMAPHGLLTLTPLSRVEPPHCLRQPAPSGPAPLRRNLVLLRSGPDSLHTRWLRDLPGSERNWDLCLSWYGDPALAPADADRVVCCKGSKYEGLADFVATQDCLWAYDYVWMPDDDLMTSWSDINLLFGICAEYDLLLAQPSLAPGSFINHSITERTDRFLLRFTSFVEIMAPVFARSALRLCAPTFAANCSGYGLDHVWPRLIGAPPCRVAVVDAVSIIHTRPIGSSYNTLEAVGEGISVQQTFGQVQRYQVFGGIFAQNCGFVKLREAVEQAPRVYEGTKADEICA